MKSHRQYVYRTCSWEGGGGVKSHRHRCMGSVHGRGLKSHRHRCMGPVHGRVSEEPQTKPVYGTCSWEGEVRSHRHRCMGPVHGRGK